MKKIVTIAISLIIILGIGVFTTNCILDNREPEKVYEALDKLGNTEGFTIDYHLTYDKSTIVVKIDGENFFFSSNDLLKNVYDNLTLTTNDLIDKIINENKYRVDNVRVTLVGGNRILSRCENGNITF